VASRGCAASQSKIGMPKARSNSRLARLGRIEQVIEAAREYLAAQRQRGGVARCSRFEHCAQRRKCESVLPILLEEAEARQCP